MAKRDFDILFLGPTKVGKTSILATMWDEIEKDLQNPFIVNVLDEDKKYKLMDKLESLKAQIEDNPIPYVNFDFENTSVDLPLDYPFGFKLRGKTDTRLKFNFWDHRGDIVNASSDVKGRKELDDLIKKCNVIIIPIDACVLMEDSHLHEEYSKPTKIGELLKENLDNNKNYLIILALTKCESYIDDPEKTKELYKNLYEYHKSFFKKLKDINDISHKISTYIVPIKTIGGIKFSHKRDKIYYFKRVSTKGFEPENADFIFYKAMHFLLKENLHTRHIGDHIVDRLFKSGELAEKTLNDIEKKINNLEERKIKVFDMFNKIS